MAKATRRTQRTQRTHQTRQPALRVSYAEAQRVRNLLLSSDVEMLSKRDVTTIINILNDVYPQKQPPSLSVRWHPLLVGMGIGVLLVIGIAFLW